MEQHQYGAVPTAVAVPGGAMQEATEATAAMDVNDGEVRTLFVLGFPVDVRERELHNLLRWWPGYEASQMTFKGDQPMGFALFSSASAALAARDALQACFCASLGHGDACCLCDACLMLNLEFDPETKCVLRSEMAKKNMYVRRRDGAGSVEFTFSDHSGYDPSKRMRSDYGAQPQPYGPGAPTPWGHQGYQQPYDPYGLHNIALINAPRTCIAQHQVQQPSRIYGASSPIAPHRVPVQNLKDNPPCNTLFIGNLSESVSEQELRGLFATQVGYRQIKILRQQANTVCFVEFQDIACASAVRQNLQGAQLATSDRGGMRIQYPHKAFAYDWLVLLVSMLTLGLCLAMVSVNFVPV
eukprot:jgi/Chlat1/6851/Chrsp51S06534